MKLFSLILGFSLLLYGIYTILNFKKEVKRHTKGSKLSTNNGLGKIFVIINVVCLISGIIILAIFFLFVGFGYVN